MLLPLCSPRLCLRRLRPADIAALVAYRSDPEVARYQDWESYTTEQAAALIRGQRRQAPAAAGRWTQLAITLTASGILIGDCGLLVHGDDPRQVTVGITLARHYQRRGYATEALTTLFDHLFEHMEVHRISASIDPGNDPSWRMVERLGMRREGHSRASVWFKGAWADDYHYAILRDEWRSRRSE